MTILEQLQAKLMSEYEKPPKGFKTTEQWAAEWGLSRERAGANIRKCIAHGLLVRRKYRTEVRLVPHYGPPEKKR